MAHEIKLGQLITDPGQKRDAIHIAVAPVVSRVELSPGQPIGFENPENTDYVSPGVLHPVGIVDPFLTAKVRPYDRFFMLLYPNTVTGMRHQWEHPAFQTKAASEQWLRDFCRNNDCPSYDIVMAAVTGQHVDEVHDYGPAYRNEGDWLTFFGRDAHCEIPDEFWEHAERVTGMKITDRPRSFSCSC